MDSRIKIKDLLHLPKPLITIELKHDKGSQLETYYIKPGATNRHMLSVFVIVQKHDSNGKLITSKDHDLDEFSRDYIFNILIRAIKHRCSEEGGKIIQNNPPAWKDYFGEENPFPERGED